MMYQKLCTEFYDNDKPLASAQEVDFYGKFFTREQLLLEPMCGSGRLLIPLLRSGYKVHGLDNSSYMLQNCKNRLAAEHLNTEIFLQSVVDMKLPYQYDGIIIPFGSFQLLYPRNIAYQALDRFCAHLKPGGKIILDIEIPWEAYFPNKEEVMSSKQTIFPDGTIIKHTSHIKAHKLEQYYTSNDTYEKIIDNKIVATEHEQMTLCWYFIYEFELILQKHGFSNVQRVSKVVNGEELMVFVAEKEF